MRQPVSSLMLSELFGHEKREALLASQRFQDGNCNYTRKEKKHEKERERAMLQKRKLAPWQARERCKVKVR